jgi:thioredoxin-related protein
MITRRTLLAGTALGVAGATAPRVLAAPVLTDDGLYHEPWFLESFLILPEDLDGAAAKGKRFAVIWELKGCPLCRQMHLVNFADPAIESYIRERFDILQLNIIGSREVTDFDGEKLTEKQLARKYGVRGTPTVQFFPEAAAGLAQRGPREREVHRIQGYVEPKDFRTMFAYVADKAYERGALGDYLKAQG